MVESARCSPPFCFYSSSHAVHMAHWPVTDQAAACLDRTVEAVCQNVTKNSERQPQRQNRAHKPRRRISSTGNYSVDYIVDYIRRLEVVVFLMWVLSDFLQYSAGFHVVLVISGNCFFTDQRTGVSPAPAGFLSCQRTGCTKQPSIGSYKHVLIPQTKTRVSSLISCTLGDNLLFLDLSDGAPVPFTVLNQFSNAPTTTLHARRHVSRLAGL
jgi:hypothetical protein